MGKTTVTTVAPAIAMLMALVVSPGCSDDDSPSRPAPVRTEIGVVDFDLGVDAGDGYPEAVGPELEDGVTYVYVVEGTYSIWGVGMWNSGVCKGTPEGAPQHPSPGATNGPTGVDAEFWFAVPSGSALCDPDFNIPNHTGLVRVSLDGGDDYSHIEPIGGRPLAPSTDHRYEYEVVGQGHEFRVRRVDAFPDDDYGILRYTIYRLD